MRYTDLFEKSGIEQLRKNIVTQVGKTTDEDLLNRIYSSLNSTNLRQRLSKGLARSDDRDIQAYLDQIVHIIINTPGTYEEKIDFADGLKDGYVDVNRMVSGERVHFEELLTTNRKGAPLAFVRRLFHALKDVGAKEQKGPGEFALAVMSPEIKIFGSGDLKIGNHKIEVKASAGKDASSGGGRLGTTGFLQHEETPSIVKKYMPAVDVTKTLGIKEFEQLVKPLDPKVKRKFAEELFGYIFRNKHVNLNVLVDAMVKGEDLSKAYTVTAYAAYQGPEGSHKFDGVMLMNFALEELKYFKDPESMTKEMYAPGINIITANKDFAGRLNMPAVTLKPEALNKVDLPGRGAEEEKVERMLMDYATYVVRAQRIRDPDLIERVFLHLAALWQNGVRSQSDLRKQLLDQFPELRKRQEPAKVQPAQPQAQQPAEPRPEFPQA